MQSHKKWCWQHMVVGDELVIVLWVWIRSSVQWHWICWDCDMCLFLNTCYYPNGSNALEALDPNCPLFYYGGLPYQWIDTWVGNSLKANMHFRVACINYTMRWGRCSQCIVWLSPPPPHPTPPQKKRSIHCMTIWGRISRF